MIKVLKYRYFHLKIMRKIDLINKLFNFSSKLLFVKSVNIIRNIKIRFTTKNDLNQLPWLYKQYFNGETNSETDVGGMLREFQKLSKNEDYKFVSAVFGEKLVGFCSIVVNHDIVKKQKPILLLLNLRVHPDYRNYKIGQSILNFVDKFGKSINGDYIFLDCELDNIKGKRFYEKNGFIADYGFYKYL